MRTLPLLASCSLLLASLEAQCVDPAAGTPATLVPTTTFFPADDEGLSAPIDMQFGPGGFPMQGAAGPLTHVCIGSNGELYLTSGGAPVDPYDFGGYSLDALRGLPGASPRIWPCSTDLEGVAPTYSVRIDTTVPGECTVTWIDVQEFASGGPAFRFGVTMSSSGVIEMAYGALPDTLFGIAGVSIGNGVGTGTELPVDFTAMPDSGTLGLIYQEFDGVSVASFSGLGISFLPNGQGGYTSVVSCQPATHTAFGSGCHTVPSATDESTLVESFAGTPAAKAALDGNALLFVRTFDGYATNWLPGVAAALYLPPSGSATTLALMDDDVATIAPSVAPPVPGGFAPTWTVSSNGILTAAPVGNHGDEFFANLADIAVETGLAFYCWRDYDPSDPTGGSVKYEEVGGVLAVTFDGVFEYFTTDAATFQWQIDLATGNVTMVWVSMAPSTSVDDMIVGCTLAGAGAVPVSSPLVTPFVLKPPFDLAPLTLSATPPPVINPSTLVTYTANNLPEFVPGSGVYLATCFLSVSPNPAGFDLAGILTTVPGCNAYILTLDLDLGAQVSVAPTASWSVTFDNVNFAPGNVIAAQAVALFDPSFPLLNGESGGFLLSNGVQSYVSAN